ncbi:metal-dependent hydrolase [Sporosarcina siberiensis]|uniref:Metal-dependent hydrolase n=1 Tax=Sporosarcina siberiensis TaxID=1365606 RepID=A0ABW4SFF9_9BACL
MKGSSHLTLGIAAGVGIGLYTQAEPVTIGVFAVVGGVAGLFPDLDTNGLASNKITLSKSLIKMPLMIMGICVMLYSLFESFMAMKIDFQIWGGILIGGVMILLSSVITQKRMLSFTGVGIILGGIAVDMSYWIILVGIYIVIASFLPHRSYTHSIIGLVFFSVILYMAQEALNLEGLFIVGMVGYISHLIADMKWLPMNRRGVRLFAPIWNREF